VTTTPPIGTIAETASLYDIPAQAVLRAALDAIEDPPLDPSERAMFADQLDALSRIVRGAPRLVPGRDRTADRRLRGVLTVDGTLHAVLLAASRGEVWLARYPHWVRGRWLVGERPNTPAVECLLNGGLLMQEHPDLNTVVVTAKGRAFLATFNPKPESGQS
jgi:hypothetical protein